MPSKEPIASPSPSSSSSVSPSPSFTASPSAKGACFPGRAAVSLQGGRVKRMDEVELGDKILVGKDTYSSIFMFTHKMDNILTSFARLRTAAGPELDLTSSHYIYVNGRVAAASTVRVGDRVILGNGSDTTTVRTEFVSGTGLFIPQTIQGDIVVNGILSTTYTRAVQPAAGHALLVPLRFLYELFGLSTKFAEQGLVE